MQLFGLFICTQSAVHVSDDVNLPMILTMTHNAI